MDEIPMSAKARVRLDVMRRVERGELTMTQAAPLMRVSLRQAKRIRKRFKTHGDAGLVHRLRKRPGNRRLPEELRQRIVKRHHCCPVNQLSTGVDLSIF